MVTPVAAPRSGKSWVWLGLGVAAAALLVAVVLGLIFRGSYETEQTATRSFAIDQNFTTVRKILVRKDGAKQLVTMGGGSVFRDQKWSDIDADLGAMKLLDPNWRVELHGVLQVRTQDDYVGEQDIDLEQDVEITPDFLHSAVKLKKPAERLRDYRMTTLFDRGGAASEPAAGAPVAGADASAGAEAAGPGSTHVTLTLTEKILTDAPWFAHSIADRRVRASVERTLANQEAAIRKLVADNLDDVPLLPLR
jgi:hypothetical protein